MFGGLSGHRYPVPVTSLAKVAPSKAFIYWLEMMAQILSIAVVAPHVHGHLVCFVDNTAAEHALRKGCSKDEAFTKTLACFWAWVADNNLQLSFHRVTSAANLSDGVSRGSWKEADSFGCQRVCPKFETSTSSFWTCERATTRTCGALSASSSTRSPITSQRAGVGNSAGEWRRRAVR